MKLHPIFSNKNYKYLWLAMALFSLIRFYIFGTPEMEGYEGYGIIFWTLASMFCGLVFGSIIYLLYRLIARKWNNTAFMICIAVMWLIVLITI